MPFVCQFQFLRIFDHRKWHTKKRHICNFRTNLSYGRICLIKRSLCGDYCNHASRSYLVKCFCKEIIVDTEVILVVLRIKNLIITKWHISNNHIKEVIRICGILKSCDTDIGILIKLSIQRAPHPIRGS